MALRTSVWTEGIAVLDSLPHPAEQSGTPGTGYGVQPFGCLSPAASATMPASDWFPATAAACSR